MLNHLLTLITVIFFTAIAINYKRKYQEQKRKFDTWASKLPPWQDSNRAIIKMGEIADKWATMVEAAKQSINETAAAAQKKIDELK